MNYDVLLGRLRLPTAHERKLTVTGAKLDTLGAAVIPGDPSPRPFNVTLPVYGAEPADGQRLRRQAEALFGNAPLLLEGLFYAAAFDPDAAAWLVIGGGELDEAEGGAVFGEYGLSLEDAYLVGKPHSHRRGYRLDATDRRLSTTPRDYLQTVYSTDFASATALRLATIPGTITDLYSQGQRRPVGADGSRVGARGRLAVVRGFTAGDVLTFEQDPAQRFEGDVLILDRRGTGVRNLNPDAEYDPSYWTPGGAGAPTHARSTASPLAGTASFILAATTSVAAGAVMYDYTDFPVTAGEILAARVTAAVQTYYGYGRLQIRLDWMDAAGAILSSVDGAVTSTVLDNLAHDYVLSGTVVPPGVAKARMYLRWIGTAATGSPGPNIRFDESFAAPVERVGDAPPTYAEAMTATFTSTDPQADLGWEEVYGPDQPLTLGDLPVLDNGLCRVRWVRGATYLFALDAWIAGTGYVEQGRVHLNGYAAGPVTANILHSVNVEEWTPDRAVLRVVMADTAGVRLEVYITLERGWTAPRFEVYTSHPTNPTTFAEIVFSVVDPSTTEKIALWQGQGATPGSNFRHSAADVWTDRALLATFGAVQPWVALQSSVANRTLVVAIPGRAADSVASANGSTAYNANRRGMMIAGGVSGYTSVRFAFGQGGFNVEAEAWPAGLGTTVADGAAAGGNARNSALTAEGSSPSTIPTANWTQGAGRFGVWARVRAVNAGTVSIRAVPGSSGTGTTTVTTTSTTYVWLYLGELDYDPATNGSFQIRVWSTGASANLDTFVVIPLERRVTTLASAGQSTAAHDGARDAAQAALYDVRRRPQLLER